MEALDESPLAEHFYTPWGGPAAVRTMVATSAQQIYLDIHVGGIVRTCDGGASWEAVNEGLELDVHEVAVHASKPERVYTATADGFYLSEDEGATWQRRNEGVTNLYCRGIAIHPRNSDLILMSGSPTGPGPWRQRGPRFALFRSEDAGGSWERITHGLPQPSPAVIDTRCLAFSSEQPDVVACGLRSGEFYLSEDAGVSWRKAAQVEEIRGVSGG